MGAQEVLVFGTSSDRKSHGNVQSQAGTADGAAYVASYWDLLAKQGREYIGGPAAAATTVTGQTSLATTTPTFLLRVPDGIVAIPSFINLAQAGTVAGGAVSIIIEYDNADRWSSGGTAATVLAARTDNPRTQGCTLYTGATATDAYGVQVWGALVGQDVSPAEGSLAGVIQLSRRAGTLPMAYLRGPASWLVFTYPSTSTAPTWFWSLGWFEITKDELPS